MFLGLFCPLLGIDVYEDIFTIQLSTHATVSSTNISIRHYIKESKGTIHYTATSFQKFPYKFLLVFCNSVHYALKLLHYTQNKTSNININLPNNKIFYY